MGTPDQDNSTSASSSSLPHPLSPTQAALARRIVSNDGYFDLTPRRAQQPSTTNASPPCPSHITAYATNTLHPIVSAGGSSTRSRRAGTLSTPADDLLGLGSVAGPSRRRLTSPVPALFDTNGDDGTHTPRRFKPRGSVGSSAERTPVGSNGWAAYLDCLGRDELALLDTRFDDMTDGELASFLEPYAPRVPGSSTPLRRGSSSSASSRRRENDKPTEDVEEDKDPNAPLFPPSPPSRPADQAPEHPLRVLSRAVRELHEVVTKLELENARLREEATRHAVRAAAERPTPPTRGGADPLPILAESIRTADQVSLHDGLADALSTSLTSPGRMSLLLHDGRTSPTPSYMSSAPRDLTRPKSPSPSTTSARSQDQSLRGSSIGHDNAHKRNSAWGTIWGWGKKPGRKGSATSLAISVGSATVAEEDEQWRKGDGGSAPSFRAIFLATRILTPDPGSILVDTSRGPKLAALAHTLISNARDAEISPRDPPGRQRARSRAASVSSQAPQPVIPEAPTGAPKGEPGYSDQAIAATVAVGRTLLSRGKAMASGGESSRPPTTRPALLNRASTRPFPTTAMAQNLPSPGTPSPPGETPPPSVELASIVPDESRPPTVLLSRQNLGSFFQSSRQAKLATATRFTSDQPPLTDRYGFIYDIQHASMLKDASRAGTPAPISLTGHIPESTTSTPSPATPIRRESLAVPVMNRARSRSSGSSRPTSPTPPRSPNKDSGTSTPPNGTGKRRATLRGLAGPPPSLPTTGKDDLTVSVRGASSLQTSISSSTSPLSVNAALQASPSPEPAKESAKASRLTVSSLLDQLTDIHDRQQKARTAEWDAFLRKRTRARRGPSNVRPKSSAEQDVGVGAAIAAVVNAGQSPEGKEEYKAFLRLARRGIPIPYRADVWAECSGARDLLVPGEYAEILAVHKDDNSPVMAEIEKDVGRTFPGNVFFGGDGPGVAKLRRVLVAYSWHNPAVGYCQGMNMLAATLLLTHTDEEQAFWVLHCIIERLLPTDYFAPSLLGSRADQLALNDLVAQHIPRLSIHLAELGVDLASVTFGWFLSLFTDCLPVETLFRVWDIFFVEGHDVLFRVAIAMLKLYEAELCGTDSVTGLFACVAGMTSRLWGADRLMALQHGLKHGVRHAEIVGLVDKHVAALQAEMDD